MASLISRLNPLSSHIKWYTEEGKPKTVIRTGSTKSFSPTSSERTPTNLKKYWQYYSEEGNVFSSLNSTSWNTSMTGYTIHSENPKAKKLITDLCNRINIETSFRTATLYTLIFGDAFLEKVYNRKGEISRLKNVDPRTMFIEYDNFGIIKGFYQEIGGRRVNKKLKPEDIIHIRFFEIPSSPYGVSMIAPNVDTINRKVQTDEALFNAIKRHGTKKWVATVGSEKDGTIPPDDVMDDIKEELEDIGEKNEFVVPWMVKLETIDERGIEGVEEYFNYFQTQLTVGLMCPEEALGLGKGSTEATARQKAILYERMIKAFQNELAQVIRGELFNPYLEKNRMDPDIVFLQFKSVTEEDEAQRSKWLGNLLHYTNQAGQMPFTRNEIRAMFGFPPRKDMEDVPSGPPKDGKEDKKEPIVDEEEDDESNTST